MTHVVGIAGVAVLLATFGQRFLVGGEAARVVSARLVVRDEPRLEEPEPDWTLEAPGADPETDPIPREAEFADPDAPLFDDAVATTTVEVAYWTEPLDLPRFEPPSDPPLETEPEPLVDEAKPDTPEQVAAAPADVLPVLVEAPPPAYPTLAQRRGWEGVVLCLLEVDAEGRVVSSSLDATSGHSILDEAALDAVRRWRFAPGQRAGLSASFEVRHRVVFRLRP